jgi:ribosomal protein S18 acetylase RimI-like enzyme
MSQGIVFEVDFAVDDRTLSQLQQRAFGSSDTSTQLWRQRLQRHSLTWVGAFNSEKLIGFINVCWDGGSHAFILDTAVDPDHQRQGIGQELVRRATVMAKQAGCEWLHVDYEPHLRAFYLDTCRFRDTEAGLLRLTQ